MKHSYYNFAPDSIYTKPAYDLNKWLEAMRSIFTNVHFGHSFKDAFGSITSNWNTVEKKDFGAWIEYYQSDNQNKYKTAQLNQSSFYVNDNIPGYFLPNPIKSFDKNTVDISEPMGLVNKSIQEVSSKEDKRKIIEEQRKKIISRLHAAVKHLTNHEGHMLAGEEFDKLLSSMYELIKQFQTVNKISLSNQLYTDLIIRQSNKLLLGGFDRSSNFLRKFAQGNIGRLDASGPLPIGSQNSGPAGGSLDNPTPPLGAIAPDAEKKPEADEKDTLDELFDNLETAGLTDSNFIEDDEYDELHDISLVDDDIIMVEAQVATQFPNDAIPRISKPTTDEEVTLGPEGMTDKPINESEQAVNLPVDGDDFEVSVPDDLSVSIPEDNGLEERDHETQPDEIDAIIDDALSSVNIQDVIKKLDSVTSIFRNRQLSRELMIIDMMLHRLGLISLFPELAESNQKLLEAHSYILSRLEKITSQLNGTIANTNVDLSTSPSAPSPHVQMIKDEIEEQQAKDKANKQRRKNIENKQLEELDSPVPKLKETIPVAQELANTPAQIVQ